MHTKVITSTDMQLSSYLHPRLGQRHPLSQLLARIDIWVVRPLERLLQLFELLRRESSAIAALFSAQSESRLRLRLRYIYKQTRYRRYTTLKL